MRTQARVRHDRADERRERPASVAILVYEGVQSLDVTGPLEVFAGAQRLIGETGRRSAATRSGC